jgi:hypothetical protein
VTTRDDKDSSKKRPGNFEDIGGRSKSENSLISKSNCFQIFYRIAVNCFKNPCFFLNAGRSYKGSKKRIHFFQPNNC